MRPHPFPQHLARELKHEIRRESRRIPPDLLVQSFGLHSIERGQIRIQHYPLPADHMDRFEEHRAKLMKGEGDYAGANPEDPDEYKAENVFCVSADARSSHLQASAKRPTSGKIVDDAMVALERDNPRLKGVLPKDYARPGLDKQRLGQLIDFIATIELIAGSEGEKTHRSVNSSAVLVRSA